MVDIGGGSTELIVGTGTEISFHDSLQAGVVRHSERHISSDPPTAGELEALAADVRGLIEESLGAGVEARQGIAVAGTPTSLAAVELELEPYDPARVHGHVLALPSIQRMLSQLASVPLAERVEIPGLHPDRAPTIVAGVVILVETMRAFGLERDHRLRARHPLRHRPRRRSKPLSVLAGQSVLSRTDRMVSLPSEALEIGTSELPRFSVTSSRAGRT